MGVLSALGILCFALPAAAQDLTQFDLPSQTLAASLRALGSKASLNVLFDPPLVEGREAPPVNSKLTTEQALGQLLTGSGLKYRYLDDKTVMIVPAAATFQTIGASQIERSQASNALRLADARGGQDQSSSSDSSAMAVSGGQRDTSLENQLEEVVVTAQKRAERLQDVPVPVTAVSADDLVNSNQMQLRDYYSKVPGLSYAPDYRGSAVVAIRGIAPQGTFATNPTVGVVIDDVSYGPTNAWAGGPAASEIDPNDVARVEVLRGPQGTLYGANSLGGLLKYVTIDPSTDGVSGQLRVGGSSIENGGGELGYNVHGILNVPVADTFAVRASGFKRRDPGYVDNVGTGQEALNYVDAEGGRLATLWRPSDNVSLKVSALLQDIQSPGASQVDLIDGVGELQNSNMRGTGAFEHQVRAYIANLSIKQGAFDIVSATGYSEDKVRTAVDYSRLFGPVATLLYGSQGVSGVGFNEWRKATKFTQEIRLSTPIGEKAEWLFGGFYAREKGGQFAYLYTADFPSGSEIFHWADFVSPIETKEYAAFTDLTFHFTDRFDVQVGGRGSQYRQTLAGSISGDYARLALGQDPFVEQGGETKEESFTYLVTPRLKLSPDVMVYARFASGYRPGGINFAVPGLPAAYSADKTQNYEIGTKGSLFDRLLSFDASLYYIKWEDMQITIRDPLNIASGLDNAGKAKSQGIELSIEARPLQGMTISAWTVWNDAELTEDFPAVSTMIGADGDRLPYTSRFSGNLSIDQEFPLTLGMTGFVGGSVSYVGDRQDVFSSSALRPRLNFPSYAKTDLRAGVRYDSWTANLYVNNVADKRGIVSGGYAPGKVGVNFIQPRIIGLSVTKAFE